MDRDASEIAAILHGLSPERRRVMAYLVRLFCAKQVAAGTDLDAEIERVSTAIQAGIIPDVQLSNEGANGR